jgi:hypothetical protein
VKFFLKLVAGLIFLIIVFLVGLRTVPIHVYDGFESPRLSWTRWSKYRFAAGAVAPEQSVVRAGRSALAITVHSGDRYEAASESGVASERAELMESWWLFSRSGRTYAYSFSLYLPKEIPQSSERLVIAQWKQVCESFSSCRPDRPILAIRYENARLNITRHDELGSHVIYQGDEDVRGRWLDFRFVIRFENSELGSVDATLDGRDVIHFRGSTLFQPTHGYPARALIYFKTGLYRDALHEPPWTMFVDEYRKDQCADDGCR